MQFKNAAFISTLAIVGQITRVHGIIFMPHPSTILDMNLVRHCQMNQTVFSPPPKVAYKCGRNAFMLFEKWDRIHQE